MPKAFLLFGSQASLLSAKPQRSPVLTVFHPAWSCRSDIDAKHMHINNNVDVHVVTVVPNC